jgi:hypothetical protein
VKLPPPGTPIKRMVLNKEINGKSLRIGIMLDGGRIQWGGLKFICTYTPKELAHLIESETYMILK